MLRSRSPFFTPPCSILAPRLVPISPSLTGHKIAQCWDHAVRYCLTKMKIIWTAEGQNVSFPDVNLQHPLSQHLRVLKASYALFNFLLFGSEGSGPRVSLYKRQKSEIHINLQWLAQIIAHMYLTSITTSLPADSCWSLLCSKFCWNEIRRLTWGTFTSGCKWHTRTFSML